MVFDLAFIWAGLIAFAILTYVVLDGFDLGLGILFPFAETHKDRDVMMNSVAPVWDGNETWLVLGGGGLFAVFPLAYAVVMPALYMPILIMLLALVVMPAIAALAFLAYRGLARPRPWRRTLALLRVALLTVALFLLLGPFLLLNVLGNLPLLKAAASEDASLLLLAPAGLLWLLMLGLGLLRKIIRTRLMIDVDEKEVSRKA